MHESNGLSVYPHWAPTASGLDNGPSSSLALQTTARLMRNGASARSRTQAEARQLKAPYVNACIAVLLTSWSTHGSTTCEVTYAARNV